MPRVRTTSGQFIAVTTSQAIQIRRLRRKYEAELILTSLGLRGIVGTVYGHEVIRIERRDSPRSSMAATSQRPRKRTPVTRREELYEQAQITVHGTEQDVFKVYTNRTKEKTRAFCFNEDDARLISNMLNMRQWIIRELSNCDECFDSYLQTDNPCSLTRHMDARALLRKIKGKIVPDKKKREKVEA